MAAPKGLEFSSSTLALCGDVVSPWVTEHWANHPSFSCSSQSAPLSFSQWGRGPHCWVSELLPIGCLIIVGDQAYHCCVVSKRNDGVGVVLGHAALMGPCVEDQRGRCVVAYPYHLGWPVRKSRIQLQREVFSPRVLSLVISFVGNMVLNAEL